MRQACALAAALALVAVTGCAGSRHERVRTLRLASADPAGIEHNPAVAFFVDRVARLSGGRLRIAVDEAATASLREQMRADRPAQLPTFDMGPPIEEILARALEETGLPAPTAPRPL